MRQACGATQVLVGGGVERVRDDGREAGQVPVSPVVAGLVADEHDRVRVEALGDRQRVPGVLEVPRGEEFDPAARLVRPNLAVGIEHHFRDVLAGILNLLRVPRADLLARVAHAAGVVDDDHHVLAGDVLHGVGDRGRRGRGRQTERVPGLQRVRECDLLSPVLQRLVAVVATTGLAAPGLALDVLLRELAAPLVGAREEVLLVDEHDRLPRHAGTLGDLDEELSLLHLVLGGGGLGRRGNDRLLAQEHHPTEQAGDDGEEHSHHEPAALVAIVQVLRLRGRAFVGHVTLQCGFSGRGKRTKRVLPVLRQAGFPQPSEGSSICQKTRFVKESLTKPYFQGRFRRPGIPLGYNLTEGNVA